MANILSRPMFRRGGRINSNSGIVSGFKKGGNVRQEYAKGDLVDLYKEHMTEPTEETGMTTSDWLRIAASGANIMGAPSTGRDDIWGALQAAGPSLGELGTDMATSRDARKAAYLQRKAVYDAGLADTAITGASAKMERDFASTEAKDLRTWEGNQAILREEFEAAESDKKYDHEKEILKQQNKHESALVQIEIDAASALLKKQYELDKEYKKYDFAIQFQTEKSQELADQMIKLENEGKKGSDEWNLLKSQYENIIYGEAVNQIREGRVDLAKDDEFMRLVKSAYQAALEAAKNPESPDFNKTEQQIYDEVMEYIWRGFGLADLHIPGGNAAGGKPIRRRNFANGGMNTVAPMGAMNTPPVTQPVQPNNEIQLSFDELRRRLPPEVSDQVIQLILNSEEAMIDFAQLQTPQDISIFNQKYNTDLQMPTQVA